MVQQTCSDSEIVLLDAMLEKLPDTAKFLVWVALGHGATAFGSYTELAQWVIQQMADKGEQRTVAELYAEYMPKSLLTDADFE